MKEPKWIPGSSWVLLECYETSPNMYHPQCHALKIKQWISFKIPVIHCHMTIEVSVVWKSVDKN